MRLLSVKWRKINDIFDISGTNFDYATLPQSNIASGYGLCVFRVRYNTRIEVQVWNRTSVGLRAK